MLKYKEILSVLIISVIIAFVMITKYLDFDYLAIAFLLIALTIFINIIAKKIMAYYFESEIEIDIWKIRQFWIKPSYHFKKPFPTGIVFPLILGFASAGYLWWLAVLDFDVKPKVSRAAKKWGHYSWTEMTEWHIGLIAAAGIYANFIAAIIGYLIGFPEFARLNIYYAGFNLLPISNLDGNKIFFAGRGAVLWITTVVIALIGLAYVFLLP